MIDIEIEHENGYNYESFKIMKSNGIEKNILTRKGDWKFDQHVSVVFDKHVRKSIPCYNEIQELIGIISKKLLSDNSLVYDLGTATGEVIKSIYRANPNRKIRYVGIDKSASMIEKAKEKCLNIQNVTFYNDEIESFKFEPANLIIAAFTLQFVKFESRQFLLQNIYDSLLPNSNFIFCEKIIYEEANENNFYVDIYDSWKQNHFSIEEIKAKKESLKNVMKPLTLDENMGLLRKAKFKKINLFFKWCNFVCLIANK